MNYLNKKIDSAAQLRAAQEKDAKGSTASMEALAKKNGFKSAAEMRAYQANKANKTGGSVAKPAKKATNPLSLSPSALFKYVGDKYRKATEK